MPNYLVDYVMRKTPVPLGVWRAINYTQNAFYKECFVDEMAHAAGVDPYLYRRRLLRNSPKNLAVLDAAAKKADWGAPLPAGVSRGIAVNEACGSYCAQVVEASVDDGSVRVHRVVSAIDPGHVVNPLSIEMQTEGAVIYALTAALYGEITIKDGARRAIELRRLRDAAHRRRAEGGNRDRAERRFLGRRRRAAGAAARAGPMQRDLRRHRQAHPLAATEEPRFGRGDLIPAAIKLSPDMPGHTLYAPRLMIPNKSGVHDSLPHLRNRPATDLDRCQSNLAECPSELHIAKPY